MDENKTVNEEIEESLRICEEILRETEGIIPEKPEIELPPTPDEPAIPAEKGKNEKTEYVFEKVETIPLKKDVIPPQNVVTPAKNVVPPSKNVAMPAKSVVTPAKSVATPTKSVTQAPKKTRKRSIVKTLLSIIVCVAVAVAASILITTYVANHTTVEGGSMEPCLKSGDELIVEKISYLTGDPERLDVIVFKYNNYTKYIKRIIGMPGESVLIDDEGKIYINGKPIFDEFGNGIIEDAGMAKREIELGPDEYFVLGDNRNASKDSRDKDVGAVKKSQIVGKAWLRVMPFDNFGMVK